MHFSLGLDSSFALRMFECSRWTGITSLIRLFFLLCFSHIERVFLSLCAGVLVMAIEAALTEIAMIAMVRISFLGSTIPIQACRLSLCRRRLVKQAFLEFLQLGRISRHFLQLFFFFFLCLNGLLKHMLQNATVFNLDRKLQDHQFDLKKKKEKEKNHPIISIGGTVALSLSFSRSLEATLFSCLWLV